jgi:hypothetical protein
VNDELDDDDADESDGEVPDGVAVFPEIPAELTLNPLLLAIVHTVVFLGGSADEIVQPAAADEALGYIAGYLQRLTGPDLQRTQEDMTALLAYAKQQNWEKQLQHFLQTFLADLGVGGESES